MNFEQSFLNEQIITYLGNKRKLIKFIDNSINKLIETDEKLKNKSIKGHKMYSLKISGQVEIIGESVYEGKVTKKIQFINIGEKKIDVISVKLLETEDLTKIKKGDMVEVDVSLFTPKTSQDIYYSRVNHLIILKSTK